MGNEEIAKCEQFIFIRADGYRQYGAGVLDAEKAYATALNLNYLYGNSIATSVNESSYSVTLDANKVTRISLSFLKK